MVPEPSSRDPQRRRRAATAVAAAVGDVRPDDPEARRNLTSVGGH